jgi:hypothetical protein
MPLFKVSLINPVFLLTVFSDIGTNVANSCEATTDRAQVAIEEDPSWMSKVPPREEDDIATRT